MTNKTKSELEMDIIYLKSDKNFWIVLTVCFIILSIALFICINYINSTNINLQEQLQECQEKVPVWTLKYSCSYDANNFSKITQELKDSIPKKNIYRWNITISENFNLAGVILFNEVNFNSYHKYQEAITNLPENCVRY